MDKIPPTFLSPNLSPPLPSIREDEQDSGDVLLGEQEDGSLALLPRNPQQEGEDLDYSENLVHFLSSEDLTSLAQDVMEGYEADEASRANHLQELCRGIDQLGLSPQDKNTPVPFEGACTVFHPLIMENAVKIQAKAEGELLPATGPVRAQIVGQAATPELELQANRVQRHMNYQLLEQVPEFYSNTQKALLQLALFGDAFKKNYWDPLRGRPADSLIPIDQFVVNASVENLESADRITEVQYISEAELRRRIYSGQYSLPLGEEGDTYREVLGEPYVIEKTELGEKIDKLLGFESNCEGYVLLEQHVYYDLPLEGEEGDSADRPMAPYIVCLEKNSRTILSVRRNGDPALGLQEDNILKQEWYTQYSFVPGFGFYNIGYIHLLGNFQMTLTALVRNLVDAGAFANLQGGFKSKALRIPPSNSASGGDVVAPGVFTDVEFYGQDISKLIYPFNFKEPSATLFGLLQWLEGRGQKYADSAEQVVADAANYGPVGTTMALLDASTKFFATVFKRLHSAQKKQFRIIARLNHDNLPMDPQGITFNIPGGALRISKQDYDEKVDIIPVSDPNIPSAAHRVTLASQKLQAALQAPQIHDLREAYKQYYVALGDENYEKYLPPPPPPPQQAQPQEPVQDIQSAIKGLPIQAFPNQDHDAHIAVKTAFLNDPLTMAQAPVLGEAVLGSLQANIREHVALRFASQIEGTQKAQPNINVEEAARQVAEYNSYKAQNPLGALDPKQMLAQAELAKQDLDAQRLKLAAEKQRADLLVDLAKLALDAESREAGEANKMTLKKFDEAMKLIHKSLEPPPPLPNKNDSGK